MTFCQNSRRRAESRDVRGRIRRRQRRVLAGVVLGAIVSGVVGTAVIVRHAVLPVGIRWADAGAWWFGVDVGDITLPSGRTITVRVSGSAGGAQRASAIWFYDDHPQWGTTIHGGGWVDSLEMPEWSVVGEDTIRVRLLRDQEVVSRAQREFEDVEITVR